MEEVHITKQLEYKEWEKPDSIVEATICTKCGNLAVYGLCDCAAGGSCIKKEYFAKGTVPTKKCTCHVRVTLCDKSKMLAGPFCPESCKESVVLLVKNEDYTKYNGYPGYTHGCYVSTYDTPYIYHPESECDVHNEFSEDEDEEGDTENDGELFEESNQIGIEDDFYTD